jgi:hypothetical protein
MTTQTGPLGASLLARGGVLNDPTYSPDLSTVLSDPTYQPYSVTRPIDRTQ